MSRWWAQIPRPPRPPSHCEWWPLHACQPRRQRAVVNAGGGEREEGHSAGGYMEQVRAVYLQAPSPTPASSCCHTHHCCITAGRGIHWQRSHAHHSCHRLGGSRPVPSALQPAHALGSCYESIPNAGVSGLLLMAISVHHKLAPGLDTLQFAVQQLASEERSLSRASTAAPPATADPHPAAGRPQQPVRPGRPAPPSAGAQATRGGGCAWPWPPAPAADGSRRGARARSSSMMLAPCSHPACTLVAHGRSNQGTGTPPVPLHHGRERGDCRMAL